MSNLDHQAPLEWGEAEHPTVPFEGRAAPPLPGHDVVQVGPYRVLKRIGQGSMGVVYQAEQREPIRRVVALKLVKVGMDTEEVVGRFEAERQALALMDHPNVARVYDAGATPEGRPYFAMEYAPGVPITAYCREHRLPLRGRLRLFLTVCDAVQHAHQKGIIHRDLKPGNVLVTVADGRPTPKVIDFGIAKAVAGPLTGRALATMPGRFIGTPAYMSPEQADTAGLDVDTRTDVYSLGVILYELLAGCMPFDPERLNGASQETLARVLRETEFPRPSTRLPPAAPSEAGGVTAREVRGDLDWIALKALAKERAWRYESAGALAADVRRHLANEPVLARPPSRVYRAGRFVRRHRLGVSAAAAVTLALVLGTIGTSIGLVHAEAARGVAETERYKAEQMRALAEQKSQAAVAALAREEAARRDAQREARRASEMNDFMLSVFAAPDPDRPGAANAKVNVAELKVVDLLARAAADAGTRLRDQPEAAAGAYLTLARSYEGLGLYDDAENVLRRAREVAPPQSESGLEAAARLAWVRMKLRDNAGAESLARPTLADCRRLLGERHRVTQYAANVLGCALLNQGRHADGEAVLVPMVAAARASGNRTLLSSALHNLALSAKAQGRLSLAEQREREAVSLPRSPTISARQDETLAVILAAQGKWDEARRVYAAMLAEQRPRLGDGHPDLRRAMGQYAALLGNAGEWDEALALLRDRLTAARERYGGNVDHAETADHLADLAEGLSSAGRSEEAARTFTEAIAMRRRLNPKLDPVQDAETQQWWRFATLRAGLGTPREWSSAALRSQAWCVLEQALTDKPTATFAPDEVDWAGLRFELLHWDDTTPVTGAGTRVAQGSPAELKSLPEPPPGLYLLAVSVPRRTGPAVREAAWVTFAPWQVALYPLEGLPSEDQTRWRETVRTATPAERRDLFALALTDEGLSAARHGFGPRGTGEHFGLAATARLRLPAGPYALTATSDDGLRAWADRDQGRTSPVIDAWRPRGPTTDIGPVDLPAAGEHELRVEYFQAGLGSCLWVRLAPQGPAAEAMRGAALRELP